MTATKCNKPGCMVKHEEALPDGWEAVRNDAWDHVSGAHVEVLRGGTFNGYYGFWPAFSSDYTSTHITRAAAMRLALETPLCTTHGLEPDPRDATIAELRARVAELEAERDDLARTNEALALNPDTLDRAIVGIHNAQRTHKKLCDALAPDCIAAPVKP